MIFPIIFIIRLIFTILSILLVWSIQWKYSYKIPILILLILIMDIFDTNLFDYKQHLEYIKTTEYHYYDKICDIITYILILIIFQNIVNPQIYYLLWIIVCFRMIGLYMYFETKSRISFVIFPDIFKELLFLEYISHYNKVIDKNYWYFFLLIIVLKIIYESIHNYFFDILNNLNKFKTDNVRISEDMYDN
jgi:hypothetical protein